MLVSIFIVSLFLESRTVFKADCNCGKCIQLETWAWGFVKVFSGFYDVPHHPASPHLPLGAVPRVLGEVGPAWGFHWTCRLGVQQQAETKAVSGIGTGSMTILEHIGRLGARACVRKDGTSSQALPLCSPLNGWNHANQWLETQDPMCVPRCNALSPPLDVQW